MGLMDFIKGELIEIIEFIDDGHDTLVWRFPSDDNEIKNGAQLIVRESQVAVFVNKGQIADVFQPGHHTLKTENLPVLSTLAGWKYGFDSPFKAEVYFVSTKRFIDQKWGTKNPISLRDPDFGIVRVRAFGTYQFRVADAGNFIKEFAGTDGHFTTDEITKQLRSMIVSRFADALGESKVPVLDIPAQQDELGDLLLNKMAPEFLDHGVELPKFFVENVSLPPEVEKAIDTRASMGALGNMNTYTQFKTANAIGDAANNESGMAAGPMGMGMGFAMGNQMTNAMMGSQMAGQQMQQQPGQQMGATPPPPPPPVAFHIAVNGQQTGPFDMNTLMQMKAQGQVNEQSLVWKAGMSGWQAASTVPELAPLFQSQTPPPPPPPPPVG